MEASYRWNPSAPSSRKRIEKLCANIEKGGTVCQHISSNAPQNLADPDGAKRKEGIRVAKIRMGAVLAAL